MDSERLQRFDLFADLSEEMQTNLAGTANEWSANKGDTLIQGGGTAEQLFAIEEGTVEVCGRDGDVVATVGSGEVVGEVGVLKRGLRKTSVQVAEDSKGFFLISAQVEMLRREDPGFEERLTKLMESRGYSD